MFLWPGLVPGHPYIRLARGFAYLVTIIMVLVPGIYIADQQQYGSGILCRLPRGCLAHLRQAGNFQQRQGSQFTSKAFTGVLNGKALSSAWMDGGERPHLPPGQKTSDIVYRTVIGDGDNRG